MKRLRSSRGFVRNTAHSSRRCAFEHRVKLTWRESPPTAFFVDRSVAKFVRLPLFGLRSFCLWCLSTVSTDLLMLSSEQTGYVAKSACWDTNWEKSLKLGTCWLMLLIYFSLSAHLLRRYLGSFSHNWRRTLAAFKSLMYCMPVMAFLACSRAIENSCNPVPSLGLTAGQFDSVANYALAILYGSPKCFYKSRLASLYESPLVICKQPLISSFAFPLVYWSKKIQELARIIYLRFNESFKDECWVWHDISSERVWLVAR